MRETVGRPFDTPPGTAQIHLHEHPTLLKHYLILVFGLAVIGFAFGGGDWWGTSGQSSVLEQPTAKRPILIVLTVLTDKPVTLTPTRTSTLSPLWLTATARPTFTPTPYLTSTPWTYRTATVLPPIQNQLVSDTDA